MSPIPFRTRSAIQQALDAELAARGLLTVPVVPGRDRRRGDYQAALAPLRAQGVDPSAVAEDIARNL